MDMFDTVVAAHMGAFGRSGGSGAGVRNEGKYELVDEFTWSSGTGTTLIKDVSVDGTPYDFTKMAVVLKCGAHTTSSAMYARVDTDNEVDIDVGRVSAFAKNVTGYTYTAIYVWIENGMVRSYFNNSGATTSISGATAGICLDWDIAINCNSIKSIKFIRDADGYSVSGKVYAVRA